MLPESPSQLEPDELKPDYLYLVALRGVSIRIALVIFFIFFFLSSDAHIPTQAQVTTGKKLSIRRSIQLMKHTFPNVQHCTFLRHVRDNTNRQFYTYVIT